MNTIEQYKEIMRNINNVAGIQMDETELELKATWVYQRSILTDNVTAAIESIGFPTLQIRSKVYNGDFCLHIVNIDTFSKKAKVHDVMRQFKENARLVKETKTTLTYAI